MKFSEVETVSRPNVVAQSAPKPLEAVTEEHVLAAIVGVIEAARTTGQSIEDLQAAVLAEDPLLEHPTRQLLSAIVTEAWHRLPEYDSGRSIP